MLRKLLFVMMLLITAVSQADQRLQRPAFLGVSPVSAEAGEEVVIANIHPGGTASAVGLRVGDQLLAINGTGIQDFSHLVRYLRGSPEGSSLTLSVLRDGAKVQLSGTAISRPKESGEGFTSQYGEFDWQGNVIRTITYLPETPRRDGAALMFIQGYTCDSIDYGMFPENTVSRLLVSYAQAGYRVFKMEKPGVGDSVGPLRCADYDFDTENRAFVAGLQHFASENSIDTDQLFVFGHSLGVLHAALIAEQGLVKGVIGYGGVVKPWYEYMQDIYSIQSVRYFGTAENRAKTNLQTLKPFLDTWLNTDKSWREVVQDPKLQNALSSGLLPISDQQIFDRHYSFFRSVNRHRFDAIWANSRAHVLMIHGSYDIQAIDGAWAKDIAKIVNDSGRVSAKSKIIPRTEHSLMQYASLGALRTAMNNGAHNPASPGDKYNPEVASLSLQWMQTVGDDDQPL